MSIEAMKQARNAFVWNLNTDLDNISACEQWAKMLRKNIDALDQAIADAENQRQWIGLTKEEKREAWWSCPAATPTEFADAIEAKLREKNT